MGSSDEPRPSRDTLNDDADASRTQFTDLGRTVAGPTGEGAIDPKTYDAFGSLGPGAQVGGRYAIEGTIGKGAMGIVFDASHLVIGKRVALKCLYPQHRTQPNAVERFFREARIAARVEHPNVIEVYDGGDVDGVLFLAMERLDGESLGERLERGPLAIPEAVDLFLAIMDGVAAVHTRGVVHRDLKPDNIFLTRASRGRPAGAKVLDFGISKLKEPGLRELTSLGTLLGTPYYMAPEQIASTRDVDARADVYSLGVMLYEALTGDVPYHEDSVLNIFERAQAGDALPIDRLLTDAPIGLAKVVERAMRPRREERYQSVAEMRDALAELNLGTTDAYPAARDAPDPAVRITAHRLPHYDRTTDSRELDPGLHAVPTWVFWALAAAGVVSFGALMLAIVALLT